MNGDMEMSTYCMKNKKISETGFDFNGFVLRKSYGLYKDI